MNKLLYIFICFLLVNCIAPDERVIDRWTNNQIKAKKLHYNDRDTSQYILLTYYANGQLESRTPFTIKNRNGWGVTFYDNGNVKDSVFYRDNIPTTTTYQFNSNGSLKYAGQLNELGEKYGWWMYYDSSGRLNEKTEYINDDIKTTTYYFDTLRWMIKEVIFNEGSIGKILVERNYKDSVLHGEYKKYYETGELAKAGEYSNGKRKNTLWTDFYSNGQKFTEYTFISENEQDLRIINLWSVEGTWSIKEGNGSHVTYEYCLDGKVKTKITTTYKKGRLIKRNGISVSTCR